MPNKSIIRICRNVFNEIINIPVYALLKFGGIIGGNSGIGTERYLDTGAISGISYSYTPNVSMLKTIISEWTTKGIQSMGIYHIQFFDVQTLSDGDIRYIGKALLSMPEEIDSLYFPLVIFPNRIMVCFKAIKI